MAEQIMRRSEDWSRTYVSSKVPLTKELVSEVLPTARNPKTATFLWTCCGSFFILQLCFDSRMFLNVCCVLCSFLNFALLIASTIPPTVPRTVVCIVNLQFHFQCDIFNWRVRGVYYFRLSSVNICLDKITGLVTNAQKSPHFSWRPHSHQIQFSGFCWLI